MSSGIPLPRGESADRRFSSDPVEETSAIRYFLGVDVGGTFTDVVVGDTDGHVATVKVPTTPDDPREGVAAGVAEILRAQGVGPRRVSRVVHGTTLAANVILERKGSVEGEEGCLSFPGLYQKVRRAKTIKAQAYTLEGHPVELIASDMEARVWQHEVDHLNGVLFIDKIGPIAKMASRGSLREVERD